MKLIHKTINGQIAFCPCRNIFYLEFGNMLLNLTHEDLKNLHEYVGSIDHECYLNMNQDCFNKRKLLLNIGSARVSICLNGIEFIEFRELLSLKKHEKLLKNSDVINCDIVYN